MGRSVGSCIYRWWTGSFGTLRRLLQGDRHDRVERVRGGSDVARGQRGVLASGLRVSMRPVGVLVSGLGVMVDGRRVRTRRRTTVDGRRGGTVVRRRRSGTVVRHRRTGAMMVSGRRLGGWATVGHLLGRVGLARSRPGLALDGWVRAVQAVGRQVASDGASLAGLHCCCWGGGGGGAAAVVVARWLLLE